MKIFTRLLMLLLLLSTFYANGQTDVSIGANSGSNASGSTGTSYFHGPLPDYYKTNKAQYLYTASELSAAGLVAGNITKIGWTVTATNSAGLIENYTISIKSTTTTSLSAYETSLTDVYGPINYTPVSGLNQFTLSSPFYWNGTSNIVIQICGGLSSGSFTSNASCQYTTITGFTGSRWYRSDTGSGICAQTLTSGTSTTQRARVVLTGIVASCVPPTSSAATLVTAATAQANWTPGTGTYIVEYGPTATFGTPGTGATAGNANNTVVSVSAANFYALSGLTGATGYSYVVRQDCTGAGNGYSTNSSTITFTTLTPPPANDACANATTLVCNAAAINGTTVNTVAETAPSTCGSSQYGVWYTFTGDGSAVTLTSTTTFDHSLSIYSGTCGALTNIACRDNSLGTESYSFTTVSSTTYYVYVAYYQTGTTTGTFTIGMTCIACPSPTASAATLITGTTAQANWTPGTGTYIVEYGPTATFGTPGTGATAGNVNNTVVTITAASLASLTGLTPVTGYSYVVRQDCSGAGNGYSTNSSTITFTTLVACPAPTASAATLVTATTARANWTPGTGSYILEYGPTATFGTPGTGATAGNVNNTVVAVSAANFYVMPGLTGSTGYSYVVRQDCTGASNGYSTNSSTITFTTPAPPPANDLCSGAINLNPSAAASGSVSSTTVGAANDYSGPCNSGNTSPDLFYYIDVPNGYVLVIGQTVNGYDSEIYAGYGGSCPGTTQIACYDDADIQNTTWTNTTGSTQTVYWVQDGFSGGTDAGTFTLAWTLTVAPSVPDCATLNTPADAATGVVRNTPLTWTAAATGGTPTGYKVYLGTATNPALVATVNAPATTYTPTGQAYSTTYYWRVVPTNATGDAVGCTTEYSYTTEAPPPPPVNDACAGATALVCNASAISGSTVNTVAETAPSACLGQYGVWYTFTGDGSNVTITCDAATGFDQEIVVFSGACGSLTEISCEDQGFDGGIETYSMSTTNATTYYVYVAHYSTSATSTQTGTFTIGLTCTPANNDCSGAININGNGGQAGQPTGVPVAATTVGATQSLANTCGGNADDDVWFTYTTDIDGGNVTINVTPSGGFDPVIQLYSGSCGAPVSIACENATQLTFTGQAASTTYFIRVYDFGTGLVGDVEERAAGGFTIAVLGSALPIELTSFTGKVLDHSNLLQWTTATERNVQSHNIERSLNGINNWTLVGQTASKGDAQTAQSYSLEDRAPLTQSYYRLRTVDNAGQEQLSQVITLTHKDARFGILSAFPNPATESIAVQFNTNEEGTVTARITDVTGRLVAQQQMGAEKGINMLPIQLGQLSAGTYFVTLQNGSNITEPVRFVKQ